MMLKASAYIVLASFTAVASYAAKAEPMLCQAGYFESGIDGRLSPDSTKKLIGGLNRGAALRVKLTFSPGDKDSKTTETWFVPVAVSIIDGTVFAETPPLKWPSSRYSWTSDSTAVGTIASRISSDGELAWAQNNESAKSERVMTSWCLSN